MTLSLSPRFTLEDWQTQAVAAWRRSEHPTRGPRHGIFDIFTGAGKTVLALAAMIDAASEIPDLKVAIVVPTTALVDQWAREIEKVVVGLAPGSVGRCGGGDEGSFAQHRVVVYFIDAAVKHLARHARGQRVMMIVDECHRAASKKRQEIFAAGTVCRLGLSATAQRSDLVDHESGAPLPVERQPHGIGIGPVCYRLSFQDAMRAGLLPPYEIHHHKLALSRVEDAQHTVLNRECSDAASEMDRAGAASARFMAYVQGQVRGATPAQIAAAKNLQAAYLRRKQWLYGVSERERVARAVLVACAHRAERAGQVVAALLFNERVGELVDEGEGDGDGEGEGEVPAEEVAPRVDGATALYRGIVADVASGRLVFASGKDAIAIEHSRLTTAERDDALDGFRAGTVRVLVSVKALTEGIDVPDADVAISVASTSSARQRIQTMGRLLRYPRDAATGKRLPAAEVARRRPKELHLLYVGDSADTRIYLGQDWAEETGKEHNFYWAWPLHAAEPVRDEAPPKPPPTEEEAWSSIAALAMPQRWAGVASGDSWSYRQDALFRGKDGPAADNPADAVRLLTGAARAIGRDVRGVFKVTPRLGVVLKAGFDPQAGGRVYWACGRLAEPLRASGAGGAETASEIEANDRAAIALELDEAFGGEQWFGIVNRAFLAAVDADAVTLAACRALLERRAKGRSRGIPLLDLLEVTGATEPITAVDLKRAQAQLLVECGVRAYARADTSLLRQCRDELARRAITSGKRDVAGLAAALGILLGETRAH